MNSVRDGRRAVALEQFASALLLDNHFDRIVPVERKGTALVRSVVERHHRPDIWERVCSTTALDALEHSPDFGSILVLDDSVWHGRTLGKVLDRVRRIAPRATISTAAFVSHRDAPQGDLDVVFYRSVDDDDYADCRSVLVEHLKASGSLLLDTEHVEVRASTKCSASDVFDALAGWGSAVKFAADSSRVNCTVLKVAPDEIPALCDVSPPFASLKDAVCKLRVVALPERSRTFSLIPILYPALIRAHGDWYNHPRMTWPSGVRNEERLFQTVGLCLSLELLADAIGWLKNCLGDSVEFEWGPEHFAHLKSVVPEIKIGEIVSEIEGAVARKHWRREQAGVADDPGISRLDTIANEILLSCYDRNAVDSGCLKALYVEEILEIGPAIGHTRARASAALDILIDSGRILPQVMRSATQYGADWRRAFLPDGELQSRRILQGALRLGRGLGTVSSPKA